MIVALGLTTSLMAAPATAAPTPTPTSPAAAPTTAPNPVDAAKQEAKKQNRRVEIPSYRAETSTTFANPDGKTLYTELHSTPIRVQKDGTWQPVDTTLVEEGGIIRPKAVKGEFTLSVGGDTTLLKTTSDKGQAALSATAELPRPHLAGDTATYPSAYGPGVDLVVTATPTGLRQKLVIRERPASKKKLNLRIPVDLPRGMRYGKDPSGKPALLTDKANKADKKVASITAAPMLDAAAIQQPETGHAGTATTTTEQNGGDSALLLTPDTAFLADPAVTYPVTVALASDTWTGTGIAGDTFVSTSYPNGAYNDINYQRIIAGKSNNGTATWRGYIDFTIKDTPLEGGTVNNADLRLWNFRANACTSEINSGIVARRITSDWTVGNLTWNNQPSVTTGGQVGNKGAYSDDCPRGEGELYHSIETMVQAWMDGTADHGVQLSSASESDNTNWRWYRSYEYGDWGSGSPRGPVLFIEYEPGTVEEDVVIPTIRSNPSTDGPIPYEEAMAGRLEAYPAPPGAQDVTPEQTQVLMENSIDTYEVNPDDLLPLPEEEPPASDETLPSVIYTIPSPGAENVVTATPIQVTFDEPVSGVVVTVKDTGGAAAIGSLTMAGEDKTAIFTPSTLLAPEVAYTVEVTGAQDAAGNAIAAPYTWSFTTGQIAPSPTPTATPTNPPGEQHTVSLPVQTDTWIDNQGSLGPNGPVLWTGAYGSGPSKTIERAYLTFDTSSLAGKTITDAKLELWNTVSYGCGDSTSGIKAQQITTAWSVGTLTWNNQPSATTGGETTVRDPSPCVDGGSPDVAWNWPVTGMMQAWASGQSNHGLLLRGVDESASAPQYDRGYFASEAAQEDPGAHPPVLKVTYTNTAPTPTPTVTPTATPMPTTEPDTTPPTAVEVSPAAETSNTPPDAPVTVTFSEPVTDAQLSLINLIWEQGVSGTTTMDAARTVLTFTPDEPLNGFYRAEISGVKDAAGNAMNPYSWMFSTGNGFAAQAKSPKTLAKSDTRPTVGKLWTRPFTTKNGTTSTSTTTPHLMVKVTDPLHRRSTVNVEVAHDPIAPSQGRSLIWSGTVADVSSGSTGILQIPAGKLKNSWKVRWRARAMITDTSGAWSGWQSITIQAKATSVSVDKTPPQELSTADIAAAPKTFPYSRVDWGTCNQDLLAQVKRARPDGTMRVGHTTNPYNWCAAQGYGFPVYKKIIEARTGREISQQWRGQINFNLTARAYTYAGGKKGSSNAETDKPSGKNSRDITFAWRITGIRYQGDLTYFNPMTLRAGLTASSDCQVKAGPQDNGTSGKNALFTAWDTNPEAEWTINAPKSAGTGKNLISSCMIVPTLRYSSPMTNTTPGGDVTRGISIQYPVARCDTSELIERYTGGCVFVDVSPVLIFDAIKNAGIKESTKHVWDAYYHPEWTYPLLAGKKVPGRAPNGLLHRTIEGAVPGLEDPDEAPGGTIQANRAHSISKCREKWPTVRPKPDNLDCDEFPFASTVEGSLSANGNFSARYINYSDNRSSGTQLGSFYQRMRRLGQDPFWVFANPRAADRDQTPPRWP